MAEPLASQESKVTEKPQPSSKLPANIAQSEAEIKLTYQPFELGTEREARLESLWGNIQTVSSTPTWTPKRFYEQFALYNDGTFSGYYYYDFPNQTWRHTGLHYRKHTQTQVSFGAGETTILSVTVPALKANDTLHVKIITSASGGNNTVRYKLADTQICAYVSTEHCVWEINTYNRNSVSAQYHSHTMLDTANDVFFPGSGSSTSSLSLGSSFTLKITMASDGGTYNGNVEAIDVDIISG